MGGVGDMIDKVECFIIEESMSVPGKAVISPVHEKFYLNGISKEGGSYNIICARLMGLSYAQYLRFCRDCLGAEITGKGHLYPVAHFPRGAVLYQFVKLLNNRANLILWERNNPDWEQHQTLLKEHEEKKRKFKEARDAFKQRNTEKKDGSGADN